MRAVIVGNGTLTDYTRLRKEASGADLVLCADGGYKHALNAGVKIDFVIGDFDSSEEPKNIEKYVFPTRKDYTDSELCIHYANEHGCDEIVMFAVTGTRLDHSLTNILLLKQCKNGCIVDANNEIYLLENKFAVRGRKGKTLSVIPVYGDLCGVSAVGTEYPVLGETLYFGESRGNSNIITDDYCEITAESGMAVIIINNGE